MSSNNRLGNRKQAWATIRNLVFKNSNTDNPEIRKAIDILDIQMNTEHLSIHDLGRFEVRYKDTNEEVSTLNVAKAIVDFLVEINVPLNKVKISWHPEEHNQEDLSN